MRSASYIVLLSLCACPLLPGASDDGGLANGSFDGGLDGGSSSRTWRRASPTTSPTIGFGHSIAFDALRQRIVYFAAFKGETWEWDGSNWSSRDASTSFNGPTPLTYDSRSGRVVMFRFAAPATLATWDGAEWTVVTGGSLAAGREGPAVWFDAQRGLLGVFGGMIATVYGDTWEWDGASWVERTAAPSPAPRAGRAVFDDARKEAVLFGGAASVTGTPVLGDTWTWNGTQWKQKHPQPSPGARLAPVMTYDSDRQLVVVFGGIANSRSLNDLWYWNGAEWVQDTTGGAPTSLNGAQWEGAYDSTHHQLVVAGLGVEDGGSSFQTWTYGP